MARVPFLDKFTASPRRGPRDGLEPVLRNMEAVLNTKEGYGFFMQGFGLGRYTEKSGTSEVVQTLTEAILQDIQRYEPRLQDVEVELSGRDSALGLYFDVRAMLEGTRLRLKLRFDTTTGQVRLEKHED